MPALRDPSSNTSEGVIVFVIGVDSHKSSLALCVVDELGRALAARTVANSPKGDAAAYEWISEQAGGERVFGIEATGGFAYAFSVLLDTHAERVFDVPPNQTDRERGRQTTRAKSDEKDALAIARITLRERERLAPLTSKSCPGASSSSEPEAPPRFPTTIRASLPTKPRFRSQRMCSYAPHWLSKTAQDRTRPHQAEAPREAQRPDKCLFIYDFLGFRKGVGGSSPPGGMTISG
jgi:hypothetical protein